MIAAGRPGPRWVRLWFRGATAYGLLVLLPLLFGETGLAGARELRADPVSYYGFVSTALAFQLVYWTIGGDPARYRPLMPVAATAKLAFLLPVLLLFAQGRAGLGTLIFAGIDGLLAVGFLAAWRATRSPD